MNELDILEIVGSKSNATDVYTKQDTTKLNIAFANSLNTKADKACIDIFKFRSNSEAGFPKLLIQRMDDDGLSNANAYVDICELSYNTANNHKQ
jgi:non-ribosomal peptide synthetase component E (peptide arylation enzyme)